MIVSTAAAERFLAAPLLAGADPTARRAVLNVLVEERAPAEVTLLAQGQPNDHMSFLIEGSVTVLRTFDDGAGRPEPGVIL